MSDKDVELYIRTNVMWANLPGDIRTVLGNSQREYDKLILDYSIKNQLRYKGSIVRYVKKSEEMYYDVVVKYSEAHLMLYPYHLSDIVVRELRMTPFNYYINIVMDLITSEKSYDSLPNFAAADTMRLLGIGRNQYIDLMNQYRCSRKLFRRSRSLRELLPMKPVKIPIEPWWILCPGSVLESDIKMLSKDEKDMLDMIIDEGQQLVGTFDADLIQRLYHRGLCYLDVPVKEADYIYVPTLDGFVMNRVTGDYFENLLYQIFVAIDEQSTVAELSEMLDIDLQLVKNAISVFCRLGFAKKRVTGLENLALHTTWADYMIIPELGLEDSSTTTISNELSELSTTLAKACADDDDDIDFGTNESNAMADSMPIAGLSLTVPTPGSTSEGGKRIAFFFDSSLTAFLMMGNLSSSLKNHAVTLFEVGKLSDESLDNFTNELQSINHFVEGEAQRYSEHARTLFLTIQSLRDGNELDLIRGESLLSLDHATRLRLINRTYRYLVSMAPIATEACPLSFPSVAHFGPPIPEVTTCWFRLYLYNILGSGPISMYLPKGKRISELPRAFWKSRRLLITTSAHDPVIVSSYNCLVTLNFTLKTQAVFLQEYSVVVDDSEIVNVPFPFEGSSESEGDFTRHPSIRLLTEKHNLEERCGYIILLKKNAYGTDAVSSINSATVSKDPRKICSYRTSLACGESLSDFAVFDCMFGIPLFDENLNRVICSRIKSRALFEPSRSAAIQYANHDLAKSLREMIDILQNWDTHMPESGKDDDLRWHQPIQSLLFDGVKTEVLSDVKYSDAFT